jgi:hypothetical protein
MSQRCSTEAEASTIPEQRDGEPCEQPEAKTMQARLNWLDEIMQPYRSPDRRVVERFLAERRKLWGEE